MSKGGEEHDVYVRLHRRLLRRGLLRRGLLQLGNRRQCRATARHWRLTWATGSLWVHFSETSHSPV